MISVAKGRTTLTEKPWPSRLGWGLSSRLTPYSHKTLTVTVSIVSLNQSWAREEQTGRGLK